MLSSYLQGHIPDEKFHIATGCGSNGKSLSIELLMSALGDYAIGTNHVLPTDQSAKFSSGLGVEDFTKKTVFFKPGKKTLKKISKPTINLARQEGLEAHALSVEIRKIKT